MPVSAFDLYAISRAVVHLVLSRVVDGQQGGRFAGIFKSDMMPKDVVNTGREAPAPPANDKRTAPVC